MHLRVARPVRDLAATVRMYCRGLGLSELGRFDDHDGFDGVMLGFPGEGYHFEFTRHRDRPVQPSRTDDLIVFYLPDPGEWQNACIAMLEAGFAEVAALNPYWRAHGRTFVDHDGYQIVLQRERWLPG